jgi:hypothetical protein
MNKLNKKRGFSLLIVLMLSIMALAFVGLAMQMTSSSQVVRRNASTVNRKYNLLVSAVEEAHAELAVMLDSTAPAPKRFTSGSVTSADMLLIRPVNNISLTQNELASYGMTGASGVLSVRIFDMQYDPIVDISPTMTNDEKRLLPPSLIIMGSSGDGGAGPIGEDDLDPGGGGDGHGPSDNGGAYLIRVTLSVDEIEFGSVDMAMIGSNKDA